MTLGWGGRIRTYEWRHQKPLPYHLATPQCVDRENGGLTEALRRLQSDQSMRETQP